MKMKYEEAIKRLREICDRLRDENTTLEETAALYKEGVELANKCEGLLAGFASAISESEKNE